MQIKHDTSIVAHSGPMGGGSSNGSPKDGRKKALFSHPRQLCHHILLCYQQTKSLFNVLPKEIITQILLLIRLLSNPNSFVVLKPFYKFISSHPIKSPSAIARAPNGTST